MQKPKILFVSFYNEEAYGLRIMHSILVNNSYDAKMLFFKLSYSGKPIEEDEKKIFCNFITENKFDLIAFSLVSSNFGLYKSLYKQIRNSGSHKILLGGWHVSLCPEDCVPFCDYLCLGEGEEPILDVVNNLFSEKTDIQNIWYNINGNIVRNPVRALNSDLDKYPHCFLDRDSSYYIENCELCRTDPYIFATRYGTIINRGCPFHCTYCSNSYMFENIYKKQWSKMRHRNAYNVIEELKYAKNKMPNLKCVNFYDEVFVTDLDFQKRFFTLYKKEISIPFYCMFYPGTCNESLIETMRDAGLSGVWLGVQSGSQRVREQIFKRKYTNDDVIKQASIFNRHGISVKYDFILDNPFETEVELSQTYELMKHLPTPKKFNFFSLKFFPKTKITQMAIEKNVISENDICSNVYIDLFNYVISKQREEEIYRSIGITQ